MMKDGRPYTNENGWEDKELITDEPEIVQIIVRAWIVANIYPSKKRGDYHTSYGIKHILENDTGIYLTNNQFKDAMLLAGFEPVDPDELNWEYRIKKNSPAFQRDFDEFGVYRQFEERRGLSCKVLFDEIRRICNEAWEREKKAAGNTSEQTDTEPQNDAPPWDDVPTSFDWSILLEQNRERLPPMYSTFLSVCTGATLSNGTLTLYVPDCVTRGRLNNERVKDVLQELSGAEHVIICEGTPPPKDLPWDNPPPCEDISPPDDVPPSTDWNTLLEQCRTRLSLIYRPFLNQCAGAVLSDGTLTLYAPDSFTLGRLNNERVNNVLHEVSGAKCVIWCKMK